MRTFVDFKRVDKYVERLVAKGVDAFWNGWTLYIFEPTPNGYNDKRGAFRNGQWGILYRVEPNRYGAWRIPQRYVDAKITRTARTR